MNTQKIVYVSYIASTLEKVWDALTNPNITQQYWGDTRIESSWSVGDKVLYPEMAKSPTNTSCLT